MVAVHLSIHVVYLLNLLTSNVCKTVIAIHTANADATQLSRRRCERTCGQSWPSLQFPVLLVTSDGIMTALLKSYQYRSKFTQSNRCGVCLVSFKILLSTESVGSRRELVANSVGYTPTPPTRNDSTVESRQRRWCALGISYIYSLQPLTQSLWFFLSVQCNALHGTEYKITCGVCQGVC